MNKRLAGAAAALAIAGGAAISVTAVSAQDSTTTTENSSTTTQAPSTTAPAPRSFDRDAHLKAALDPLVKDSTITQAQEDKVVAALKAVEPANGPGFGKGRMRGPGPGLGADAAIVAKSLGITTDELSTELRSGKSIAAIATEKGVDVNSIVRALVDEQNTRLAAAVTAGKMTQAEADAKKADVTQRVADRVNSTPGEKGGFGHGRRGSGDADGSDTSSAAAPTTTAPAGN